MTPTLLTLLCVDPWPSMGVWYSYNTVNIAGDRRMSTFMVVTNVTTSVIVFDIDVINVLTFSTFFLFCQKFSLKIHWKFRQEVRKALLKPQNLTGLNFIMKVAVWTAEQPVTYRVGLCYVGSAVPIATRLLWRHAVGRVSIREVVNSDKVRPWPGVGVKCGAGGTDWLDWVSRNYRLTIPLYTVSQKKVADYI